MRLSIVIPVLNEVGNLEELISELSAVLSELGETFEVILVDDGSSDGSLDLIKTLRDRFPWIKGFALSRNYGQTAAISFGISKSTGDYIVTLDADLQNDPADISSMISLLDSGYDFVGGWRANRQDPFLRSLLSRLANRLISHYSSVKMHDYGCTLKAFRASKLDRLRLFGEMHRFIPIYMDDLGARMTEITVNHRKRRWGESKYGFNRIVKVLVDLMVVLFLRKYLSRPMHIFGLIGLWLQALALCCLLISVGLRVSGYATFVQTPLPLLSGVLFVGGLTAWLLGLIAELLVRIFFSLEPSRAVDGFAI